MDNLRVLIGSEDDSADSMRKMIAGLKRAQDVDVEIDTAMKPLGVSYIDPVSGRRIIKLNNPKFTLDKKTILFHEAIHSTTDHLILNRKDISSLSRGVNFMGHLFSAPAGYRAYFRIDEIIATQKQSAFEKYLVQNLKSPYLRRKKLAASIRDLEEKNAGFKLTAKEMFSLYDAQGAHAQYRIKPWRGENDQLFSNFKSVKFILETPQRQEVYINVPVYADESEHLSDAQIYERAMPVLQMARKLAE